jgi:hypothetical protein
MPRKLVWVTKGENCQGFGCSECDWVFKPSGRLVGNTMEQMKRKYEAECEQEFAAHVCAKFPRSPNPKAD